MVPTASVASARKNPVSRRIGQPMAKAISPAVAMPTRMPTQGDHSSITVP